MELRNRVKELNPGLAHFDIERAGDSITLSLGFRKGPDKAEFRLLGSKHDYYRMAMGVRLEETLEILCRADPIVEPLGVDRDGKMFVLRLRYQGEFPSAGAPSPPEKETAPPAEPEGVEKQVEIPAAPAPARKAVAEAEAPPPPPPPPPEPTPEERAAQAWEEARQEDTLQAYVRFLERHPDAPQAAEARARADELRDDQAYRQALRRDTEEVYRAFLEQFPNSPHRAEIEARIQAIEAERERRRAQKEAEAAESRRRAKAYAEARRLDTAEAYRIFLAAYPDAPEADQAKRRLEALESDDRAYAAARGDEGKLEEYLARFPEGRHRREAQDEIKELRGRRLEADYRQALARGTEEALEAFLKAWPRNPHESEVRRRLAEMRTPPEPPAPKPEPGARPAAADTLKAVRVGSLPEVDGNPADGVWGEAPEVTVAIAGTDRVLRARAVHDGRDIVLLVRWDDTSRDALYRPWVWDPSRNAYHQSGQADDGLAFAIYADGELSDPCMLKDRDLQADMWVWRAFWSELTGYGLDSRLQIRRTRMPRSNPYPARDGSGQLWIREEPDAGTYPWSFYVPVEFHGAVVASYKPSRAAGSRADVRARGTWTDGVWTVEMRRRLDTGHDDDIALKPGLVYPTAFAVYNRAEKDRHATTGVVRLELEGDR